MPETIGGLPLHPLVVHAAVVLLPLSALGLLVLLVVPRWRRTYGWLVLIGLFASTVAAWVAKESGENLARSLGVPAEHAEWGDRIVPIAALLFVAAALWFWRVRKGATGALTTINALIAAALAVIAIIVIVVVGHTGAQAAWEDKVAPRAEAAVSPQAGARAQSGATAAEGISLAEVESHATPVDCWAIVGGSVYDLTDWIAQHPGGAGSIESMCGTDATAAFTGEHGGEAEPEEILAQFRIGLAA